jgi:hypothetical protein
MYGLYKLGAQQAAKQGGGMFPWGAVIGAVGSLAGGLLGSRSNNKASDAEERSRREALQFEREREARRIMEFERAEAARAEYMKQWNMARQGLLKRWGVPMGGATLGTMGGADARASSAGRMPTGQAPRPAGMMPQQGMRPSLANLDQWQNWSNYGV